MPYHTIRKQLKGLIIPYPRFSYGYQRLYKFVNEAGIYTDTQVIPVTGESRTGKSRLLDALISQFPPRVNSEGIDIPIVRVTLNRRPTMKAIVEYLLAELKDPAAFKHASESTKMARLIKLLRACKTQAVIIDEFSHVRSDRGEINFVVADFFKHLVDEGGVNLILCGLSEGTAIINSNEQLMGRCQSTIELRRFQWNEQAVIQQVLESYKQALSPLSFSENLIDDWELRFLCATGGLMGYFHRIVSAAVTIAEMKEKSQISLSILDIAHKEVLHTRIKELHPFTQTFIHRPDEQTLALIQQIGKRKNG